MPECRNRRRWSRFAFVTLALLLTAHAARAADKYYVGAGGIWEDGPWSLTPGGPGGAPQPAPGDNVFVLSTASLSVVRTSSAPNFFGGPVRLDGTGAGVVRLSGNGNGFAPSSLVIGVNGRGTFEPDFGNVGSPTTDVILGLESGSSGTARFPLFSALDYRGMTVGERGAGILTVNNVSAFGTNSSVLTMGAQAGSSGAATFDNSSAPFAGFTVGALGSGTLSVTGSTLGMSSATLTLGAGTGSSGVATFNNTNAPFASVNFGNFTVGSLGSGALHVSGGTFGNFDEKLGSTSNITVASRAGSSGAATFVNGALVQFDTLTVGDLGAGTASAGSATLFGGFLSLGAQTGSVGTVTLDNTLTSLILLTVGSLGSGRLQVTGGTLEPATVYLGSAPGSSGAATFTNSLVSCQTLVVGDRGLGTLLVSGGALRGFPNIPWRVGDGTGSSGVATLNNTRTTFSSLDVGRFGAGTLHVNGGTIGPPAGVLSLGVLPGSTGAATFDNVNAAISQVIVGREGAGSFTLNSGTLSAAVLSVGLLPGSFGTVHYNGGTLALSALDVKTGRVLLSPGADKTLRTGNVAVDVGARIDLADNRMIVDYFGASPIATIRTLIAGGHSGGTWNGSGLLTSLGNASGFGLGYGEASALGITSFGGYAVDDTAVLITYTRYGDADLNRTVNLADFNRLATNFGQSNRFWHQGDFNYDGTVNLFDFNLLAGNFGLSAAGPEVTPQDWANLASAVPEPSQFLALAGAAMVLARRRRRQRRVG